jgi:hypothetical protein
MVADGGSMRLLVRYARLSSSGVRPWMILLNEAHSCSKYKLEPPPADGGREGVYFMTQSLHVLYKSSPTWSFQLTAARNAISFSLISEIFSPEILLQARAE